MEINLQDLERTFRIDSEYFQKKYILMEQVLNSNHLTCLTNLVNVSDGNHMKISDDFVEEGVPYYRGQDISHFFIEQANPIHITEKAFSTPVMRRSYLKQNDILLSIVGTVGKLSLVKETNKATCSCKLAILRPKIKNSNYLSIFLSSKYGFLQTERFTRGAVQQGLLLEDMDQIVIPKFSVHFQENINDFIELAHQKLEQSKQLYQSAEAMLLEELGFDDFSLTCNNVAIKSLSESFSVSGRLDAEYYQPKYDAILEKIQSYRGGFDLVKNLFTQNKTSYVRNKKSYYYIEISDINVSNGEIIPNEILVEELPDNAKIKVSKGDILVSKVRPYRGAVGIVDENDKDLICSGAFTVLKEKGKILKETLVILFRLSYYKDLLLKYNVGTSYPVIKDEDILNLPIPFIDEVIQKNIASNIQKSFALRNESKQLLAKAKAAVECAIEQGEAYAIDTFFYDL